LYAESYGSTTSGLVLIDDANKSIDAPTILCTENNANIIRVRASILATRGQYNEAQSAANNLEPFPNYRKLAHIVSLYPRFAAMRNKLQTATQNNSMEQQRFNSSARTLVEIKATLGGMQASCADAISKHLILPQI